MPKVLLILCNLRWWCFSYHQLTQKITCLHSWWSSSATCTGGVFVWKLSIYWCAQAHMNAHCNLHCVVVFVICGGVVCDGGSSVSICVCVCVCLCMQCVCGVGVVYCVFFCEDNKSTGKKDDRWAYEWIEPTHSCLWINWAKPYATDLVLIGTDRQ